MCASLKAMKRISGIVVLVAALAGIAVGASGASGASPKTCLAGFTESRGPSQLTVSGDTCANARQVSERAAAIAPAGCIKVLNRKGHLGFRKPCVQRRYSCAAVQINKRRTLRVTCKRGSRQIRFMY